MTPTLLESPETVAVSVTGAAPTLIVAKLPETFTTIPGAPGEPEELQAVHQPKTDKQSSTKG